MIGFELACLVLGLPLRIQSKTAYLGSCDWREAFNRSGCLVEKPSLVGIVRLIFAAEVLSHDWLDCTRVFPLAVFTVAISEGEVCATRMTPRRQTNPAVLRPRWWRHYKLTVADGVFVFLGKGSVNRIVLFTRSYCAGITADAPGAS